jgi:uncharacterized protein (TIGR03643 family)
MNINDINFCHYSGLPSPSAYIEVAEISVTFTSLELDRIIEMAWEDRTPFDAIHYQFGLKEDEVKALMKKELKYSSYKLWRQRVEQCATKHRAKRVPTIGRFKSKQQKNITSNKISKR